MPSDETAVILPPGVEQSWEREHAVSEGKIGGPGQSASVVNETELPDDMVRAAVETYIEEHASVLGVNQGTSFQSYAAEGSLLARSKYRTPGNVIEEIVLARDLAERDDDVGATIGVMQAIAFGEGMANSHPDEVTAAVFDQMAEHANLDHVWNELYRELLISGQITTASIFTREDFNFQPDGADRQRQRSIVSPRIGVLPAETLRIVGNDMFGTGIVALKPSTGAQERWLEELFNPATSPGRLAQMRREDPVLAALVVERLPNQDEFPSAYIAETSDQAWGQALYRLNPRMVHRSTLPKGAWQYPRPLLTRNFALLEAKRLLNLMDYALLQGGSNFLVIAKKGSDQRPALPEEVSNLRDVVKRASRTGVIVGDHRLQLEIVTPDLSELLNPAKRKLLGSKLANALLRVPEAEEDAGGEGMKARIELISRVITADRRLIKRHVENGPYEEAVKRNSTISTRAKVWFPKVILQGTQYFTDYVLKSRDRGDISRHTAVQVAGFDYDAEVRKRKLEKPDDRIMTPAEVPFSSPNAGAGAGGGAGPQDNQPGRPRGSSPNNGRGRAVEGPARARPRRRITQNAGETVTAMYDDDAGTYRIGELTAAILEEYAATQEVGRVTAFERAALARLADGETGPFTEGPVSVVAVNTDEELADVRVVRLDEGLSLLVGYREDEAIMARALVCREPHYDALGAQETALRWGFAAAAPEPEEEYGALPAAGGTGPGLELHFHGADGGVKKKIINRDESGAITSVEEVPVDADE